MEKINKRLIGSTNEKIAASYLETCGYIILDINFRAGKHGEIDIIAREKDYICFVEVKSRRSLLFGTPAEAVNKRKQDRIRKVAYIYINQHRLHDNNLRFDIVEIIMENKSLAVREINLIKNAF
ncbi:MAG TPA: YraN family protein [Pseudobacteroides sp.]|uniref:YraN family protein n=1 Tax=Pseudobacteroides sp. TaxID=1968840 RepID=UPI002F92DF67